MVKYKKVLLKISLVFISLLSTLCYAQQKESLRVQLWQRVLDSEDLITYNNKSVQSFLNNKGWQYWEDWSDTMNSKVVIDDTENGYLQLNREYVQTTVGAYKQNNGNYTILQTGRIRYYNRRISSNYKLEDVLPNGFGIADFVSDTTVVSNLAYSCFYLEADIPREGTDTQLNLKLIPLGLLKKSQVLTYSITEYDGDNLFLYDFLHDLVKKINNENTLSLLLDKKFEAIAEKDKTTIDDFIGEEGESQFEKIEDLSSLLTYLNNVYKLSSQITYKSIILGWNQDEGRFFVKSRIKNDTEQLSFKDFLINAEYYMAIQ